MPAKRVAARRERIRQVWEPARYTKEVVRAIQSLALYAQSADYPPEHRPPPPSENEVRTALDWIIHDVCKTYDFGFNVNDINGRTNAFVDGKRSVGLQIITAMKLKPDLIDRDSE
jgi:hypothetical protein